MQVWWNWQTRWTQNPVVAIPYRFDPDHRHHSRASFISLALFFMQKNICTLPCSSFSAKRRIRFTCKIPVAIAAAFSSLFLSASPYTYLIIDILYTLVYTYIVQAPLLTVLLKILHKRLKTPDSIGRIQGFTIKRED